MVMPRSVETCPSSGSSSPAIIRNSVVLPAPFGPTSPIFSPLWRAADASMKRIWWPTCLLTLSRRIMRSQEVDMLPPLLVHARRRWKAQFRARPQADVTPRYSEAEIADQVAALVLEHVRAFQPLQRLLGI